jgi:hypothetical protein
MEYRRRSVVLDTRTLEDQLPADRAGPAQAFLDALPQWDLETLHPPDWPLSPMVTQVVEAILPGLNEDGRRLYDERSLALLALGRAAWTGFDLELAVNGVVGDYLDTADTVDETLRPVAPDLALPDASARRLADEHRALDEAQRRRRARLNTLALEARKGELLADLDFLSEQLSSDRPRRRQVDLVREWVEDAETDGELDDLIADVDQLREAAPILPDQDHDEPSDWWCPSCQRLLDDNDQEAGICLVCGEADQVRPATTSSSPALGPLPYTRAALRGSWGLSRPPLEPPAGQHLPDQHRLHEMTWLVWTRHYSGQEPLQYNGSVLQDPARGRAPGVRGHEGLCGCPVSWPSLLGALDVPRAGEGIGSQAAPGKAFCVYPCVLGRLGTDPSYPG